MPRLKIAVRGAVQGVGFRPFIYRLATELGLHGWVSNSAAGVFIEVEAERPALESFLVRLNTDKPPNSQVQDLECTWLESTGYDGFEIRESDQSENKTTLVLPDLALCSDCLRDIQDPGNRRFRYPFTNCTNCGPRFTIIEGLPYDRVRTSMKTFLMCPECQREYDDPRNRRFHAQPNACPACGPHLELWDQQGYGLQTGHSALQAAAAAVRDGSIVAVKGLGGFHLLVAADSDAALEKLRRRKHREEKPFALMFPSLDRVREECELSALEAQLLSSSAAPIVLVRRLSSDRKRSGVSPLVAPGNPSLGVMLPYTPLHHLLLEAIGGPVVATSGNRAEEPICIAEDEAVVRLGEISDLFLVHNRPIVRHADDSIVRVIAGRASVLRRARGYAPLPVNLQPDAGEGRPGSDCVLAVGAHLKNSVALAVGRQVFISQHIGDLETAEAYGAFERVIADFQAFYEVEPDLVAADAHPDYLSTQFARRTGKTVHSVQHHYAHVLSGMAEHGLPGPVLGVAWDGTGWGTDQTIWGGEFLVITPASFERIGHLRTFGLPGGDTAVKEPRRAALGLLYELFGADALDMSTLPPVRSFTRPELDAIGTMLRRKLNTPSTSSVGRLFDAVASLTGLRQRAAFEGQAAMELEFALEGNVSDERYSMGWQSAQAPDHGSQGAATQVLDWAPLVRDLLQDVEKRLPLGRISMKFHNSLIEAIAQLARLAGQENVVLSGGCFQNKYLTERAVAGLRKAGFRPYWQEAVPPNDGGIALGQVLAARRAQL